MNQLDNVRGNRNGYLARATVEETCKGKCNTGVMQNGEQQFPVSFGPWVICVWKTSHTIRAMSPLYSCCHSCSRACLFRIIFKSFLVVRIAITGGAYFG